MSSKCDVLLEQLEASDVNQLLLTEQFTGSIQTLPQPLEQQSWLVQLLSSVHSFTQMPVELESTDGHTPRSVRKFISKHKNFVT